MRIRWTDSALRDFTQICDYINQRSSGAIARRVALSIPAETDQLADFPEHGRTGRKPDTRELVFSNLPYIYLAYSRICNRGTAHTARSADLALNASPVRAGVSSSTQWLWW